MKVLIIYGSERKGVTYNAVKILKDTMLAEGDVSFQELWLPRDLPKFCLGCFNCFLKGEDKCPHFQYVGPIVETIEAADGIVMASPVYGLNASAAMKNLIDHLCYMWVVHRPNKTMFSKVGFAISTTAGAGTKHANKTMLRALNYMGVKRVFSHGAALQATALHEIKDEKRIKLEKDMRKKAKRFRQEILKRHASGNRLFTMALFYAMRGMIGKYDDGNRDKEYWRSNGWLEKERPFVKLKKKIRRND